MRCPYAHEYAAVGAALAVALSLAHCETKSEGPATPTLAASAITPLPAPQSPKAARYVFDAAGKTTVDLPAPKEHIRAETTAAAGDVTVDPSDLAKTRGQVKVDVTTLTTHTFDDAKKDHSQTEHAHNWLEAGDLVTPEVKEANRWALFTIREVTGLSATDLKQVPLVPENGGAARTVHATVSGDFFLHGHQVMKEAPVDIVFHYASLTPNDADASKILVRTTSPLHVLLAEHDVKPRDNLGKLAQASFSLLGTKVGESADVTFALSATHVTRAGL